MPGAPVSADERDSSGEDASHALAVARRLATLVATGDLAALEVHQELRKALGARHAEAFQEIETRLRGMEFDSATPLIADLCTALGLPVESSPKVAQ